MMEKVSNKSLWVARDLKYDALYVFQGPKPERNKRLGIWQTKGLWGVMSLPTDMFPEITWETEPEEVTLNIAKNGSREA